MVTNIKNHSKVHYYDVNAGKLTSGNFKRSGMIRKSFAWIAILFMFFLPVGCNPLVQESQNSVSVSGTGTVLAQPDMVQISVNFSSTAPTTLEAKKAVEQTMQQIVQILQEEKVEDKFIKTTSLNYDVEYDYIGGRRIRLGQRAQQSIVVTVNDMINMPGRFSSILDKISAINGVEVQNISFDIENKAELFKQSRKLAYQKAFDKASQYAELSGRKIGKVMTISESVSQDVAQTRAFANNLRFDAAGESAAAKSSLPAGEQGVTSEINITFSLE
ncbi:MAG: SIMPL domain-containing protein [Prevotellaceae bacterium]|jgi:uncharacterized protein YggE|nr:SIMPL domain-containing protein [Prevotellaceae bacterium]